MVPARIAAEFLSLYMFGNVSYIDDIVVNNHVVREVKEKYRKMYINHEDVPNKLIHSSYKKPNLTEGNTQLWEQVKHIILSSYVSPLIAKDLSGLPRAYIITCEEDAVRDDGILYYYRLKVAGNKVTHKHFMSCFHGVMNYWQILEEGEDILNGIENFVISNK